MILNKKRYIFSFIFFTTMKFITIEIVIILVYNSRNYNFTDLWGFLALF